MTAPRHVFLDPDGTLPYFLGVIIEFPSGVRYEHQCAGTQTILRRAEGYFVPLGGPRFDVDEGAFDPGTLTAAFHNGTACAWGGGPRGLPPSTPVLPPDRLERLKSVIETLPYWSRDNETDTDRRSPLRLDETRLGELAEAWVPVLTPEGPGVLVWKNCD